MKKQIDDSKIIQRLVMKQFPLFAIISGLPAINVLIDSIVVSHYQGEEAVAAIGYISPLVLLITAIATTLSTGSQLLCGKRLGEGNKEGLNSIFNTVCVYGLLFGGILSVLCLCFPQTIATLLGAGSLLTQTTAYIRGLGIGIVFSVLSSSLIMLLVFERKEKAAIGITMLSVSVNIAGDFLNALVLNLGLFGVSLFISLSNILMVILSLCFLLHKSEVFCFSTDSINMATGMQILKYGSSIGFDTLSHALANSVILHYAELAAGTFGVAVISVGLSVITVVSCIIDDAYFNVGSSFSGIFVGQKDAFMLKKLMYRMTRLSAILYLAVYLLLFMFSKPLVSLFTADAVNITIYVSAFRYIALFLLANILLIPLRCTYLVLNRIVTMCILAFFNGVGFALPSCWLLYRLWGLNGVASSVWVSYILTIIVYILIGIISTGRFPKLLTDVYNIPESLIASRDNQLNLTIETEADAVRASEDVIAFCKEKGIDSKKTFACGLCVEEMAVFTVHNRFTKQKSSISLYVSFEDGHISIMLRDDCAYFSPKEWLKLCKPDDAVRSIGIRLTYQIAEDVNCVNSLGINILTIRV